MGKGGCRAYAPVVVGCDGSAPVAWSSLFSVRRIVGAGRATRGSPKVLYFWGGSIHSPPPFYGTEQSVPAGGAAARILGILGAVEGCVSSLILPTWPAPLSSFIHRARRQEGGLLGAGQVFLGIPPIPVRVGGCAGARTRVRVKLRPPGRKVG